MHKTRALNYIIVKELDIMHFIHLLFYQRATSICLYYTCWREHSESSFRQSWGPYVTVDSLATVNVTLL